MDPEGKVALVTGGAQGIGLAITQELLKQGVKGLSVCDVSNAKGESTVQQLQEEFGKDKIIFIKTDVCKENEIEDAFKQTVEKFGRLDIVVNNAGICNDKKWQQEVSINLNGVIQGSLTALKYMGKDQGGKGGVVVNMASIAALLSDCCLVVYAATKSGVLALTRTLGSEYFWQTTGVRVSAICPGATATAIMKNVVNPTEGAPTYRNEWMPQFMKDLKLFGTPQKAENVAAGVLHIIREGKSGSIWVCEHDSPAYQINIPPYQEMKV